VLSKPGVAVMEPVGWTVSLSASSPELGPGARIPAISSEGQGPLSTRSTAQVDSLIRGVWAEDASGEAIDPLPLWRDNT